MLDAGDLFSVLVFVCSRRLVPDELYAALRMLAFAQSCEVVRSDGTVQIPLRCKPAAPFAVRLLVVAPVVLLLGGEFV